MNQFSDKYSKEELILSVLGLVPNELFSPVQIQKLFFLLEKRLQLNYFNFKPYHYGPYDKGLTYALEWLNTDGKIEVKIINGIIHYQINNNHIPDTSNFLNGEKRDFIKKMISFIKKLSFKELCMAIYKEFPEMAENSVFFKNK